MVFTTLTFFIFLLVIFALYWSTSNRVIQNCILIGGSYFFYAWWDYRYCSLMFLSSLLDYFAGRALIITEDKRIQRTILTATVVVQLAVLGFFKYFNFFVNSFIEVAHSLGVNLSPSTTRVILPVGISFYTFQSMSYTIDVYRGHLRPTKSLVDYLAFVCFFPQLVAGPIERATHFLPQFIKPRRFNKNFAVDGCQQALWGLFKKMAIADNLGYFVDKIYGDVGHANGPMLALATICFAFQIYCDFSGYSDIAVGTAKLFGFDLMQNFNYPYFSQSIAEFWRRWHISLSTWFRDYVYIPLGGNKVGLWRQRINIMIVFTLSGLWHGASWNYVIWGVINGVLSVFALRAVALKHSDGNEHIAITDANLPSSSRALKLSQMPGGENTLPRPAVLWRIVSTFAAVCVAWVFFRAATFADAIHVFQKIGADMLRPAEYIQALKFLKIQPVPTLVSVTILLPSLVVTEWLRRSRPFPLQDLPFKLVVRWSIYTVLLWISIAFAVSKSQFIYFQF